MKKTILFLALATFMTHSVQAQKWVEKARKAVFSVMVYESDNKLKGNGNGFYIDEQGMGLSDFTLFSGAESAIVIGGDGKKQTVSSIQGANSMYDIIKFRVETDKKNAALELATEPAKVGQTIYVLPYSTQKSSTCQAGTITKVDTIANGKYYYTIDLPANEKFVSCPIMNENGQVLGIMQHNASPEEKETYAIDVHFGMELAMSPISINDRALQSIAIKKALPPTEEQAQAYLYMASMQLKAEDYKKVIDDFLQAYPNNMEGYMNRARYYISLATDENDEMANDDMGKAIEVATDKADANYNVGKQIFAFLTATDKRETKQDWTYERALRHIQDAIAANDMPIYHQTEAEILMAMGKYAEAYEAYTKLHGTKLDGPQVYFFCAKAKEQIEGVDYAEVVTLLDSAISQYTKPYTSETAPYFYERASVKAIMGKDREAVIDFNQFYEVVNGAVTAEFYYQREQSEVKCKMFQQAIDDMVKATELEPGNAVLWVERGSIHMRVNQLEESMDALKKALAIDNTIPEAYRMLGYCQAQLKQKQAARENLTKAKELGDTVADKLIEKYCK